MPEPKKLFTQAFRDEAVRFSRDQRPFPARGRL